MLHPSYTELMKVINGDSEEEKVISSHYLQLLKNFGKKKLRFSEMTKKQKNRNSKENRVLRDS